MELKRALVEIPPASDERRFCYATRFHAFLKPEEMQDVTFVETPDAEPINPVFDLGTRFHAATQSRIPIFFALAAALSVAFCWTRRAGPKSRFVAIVLLFLAACCP